MAAVVATRLLFLVGDSLSVKNLPHISRRAPFYSSVRFLSRVDREYGPLTLASLGSKSKSETTNKKIKNNLEQLDAAIEVPKSKVKAVRSEGIKGVSFKKSLDIEAAPFAAKSFSELGLPPSLIERLEEEGFMVPTDVQSASIPVILQNHDVVIQSYTGSGKTLAYLLPILSEVGPLKKKASSGEESVKKMEIEAVIVAPSRELGMQIVREFEKLLGPVDKKLVQQLVGDEVDQLLSFNFREDMHRILEHVGRRSGADPRGTKSSLARQGERQTIMVSATVPFSVIRAARSWGQDPLLVQTKRVISLESVLPSGPVNMSGPASSSSSSLNLQSQAAVESLPPALKHYYCVTRLQHKVDTLRKCVHALDAKSVIAFMNHTRQLKDAVFKLEARGMKAAELHGDLGKLARSTTLKKFKSGEVRVMVTNELSARGLDVAECDLVVNLDLPTDSIHYAHRAGRTGRLGRKGNVVTICEEPEVFVVKKLQKQLGVTIHACEFTEGKLLIKEEVGTLDRMT
ncbi:hypothetical protein F0562_011713 [Nyssa sinensis]|uniref:RNA helicase n=1 Tax=Nyssa sinensis TaxID=561372 RepID=A0A5J4ZTG0_9ASTE|nr:hypothetical protein F0562_011713 [Nyssa sinensis]